MVKIIIFFFLFLSGDGWWWLVVNVGGWDKFWDILTDSDCVFIHLFFSFVWKPQNLEKKNKVQKLSTKFNTNYLCGNIKYNESFFQPSYMLNVATGEKMEVLRPKEKYGMWECWGYFKMWDYVSFRIILKS